MKQHHDSCRWLHPSRLAFFLSFFLPSFFFLKMNHPPSKDENKLCTERLFIHAWKYQSIHRSPWIPVNWSILQGFDASILLTSTPGGGLTERDADKTLPVEGFDLVAWAKKAVEAQCPCVVSCADVLAMATRDAIVKVCPYSSCFCKISRLT